MNKGIVNSWGVKKCFMKKIVAINGSPHLQGNTNAMIDLAFEEVKKNGFEVEKISLAENKIAPCLACGLCKTGLVCAIKDDQMMELYDTLSSADALIFASPTYMGCITAQMKAFMDRSVALRRNGFLLKDKLACAFAIGGTRNGGQELVIMQLQAFMHIHGMVPVGDDNHFGGIAYAPFAEDKIGQDTVIKTTQKICRLLK